MRNFMAMAPVSPKPPRASTARSNPTHLQHFRYGGIEDAQRFVLIPIVGPKILIDHSIETCSAEGVPDARIVHRLKNITVCKIARGVTDIHLVCYSRTRMHLHLMNEAAIAPKIW